MAGYQFLVGKRIHSRFTFRLSGTATDPDTVKFSYRHEQMTDAVVSTYQGVSQPLMISKVSPGTYEVYWIPNTYGLWWILWQGIGTVDHTAECSIYMIRSAVLGSRGPTVQPLALAVPA